MYDTLQGQILFQNLMLGNIIQKSQSISKAKEIAAPALGFAPLVFQGKQGTMPAQPARGFLNDITSHLLKELIIKWAKFVNNSKSYKFGTILNF